MTDKKETFDAPAGHALAGVRVPGFWREWTPFKKAAWLHRQGHAKNLMEAGEMLKGIGAWPTEEELEESRPRPRHGRSRGLPRAFRRGVRSKSGPNKAKKQQPNNDETPRAPFWWERM